MIPALLAASLLSAPAAADVPGRPVLPSGHQRAVELTLAAMTAGMHPSRAALVRGIVVHVVAPDLTLLQAVEVVLRAEYSRAAVDEALPALRESYRVRLSDTSQPRPRGGHFTINGREHCFFEKGVVDAALDRSGAGREARTVLYGRFAAAIYELALGPSERSELAALASGGHGPRSFFAAYTAQWMGVGRGDAVETPRGDRFMASIYGPRTPR